MLCQEKLRYAGRMIQLERKMSTWNEITNDQQLLEFAELTNHFHDSCIKELRYISGAYVDSDLWMHPLNDQRLLRMVIQCQSKERPVFEMEFGGLKYLKLSPVGTDYTCEITDTTMFMKSHCVYWCDSGGLTEHDFEDGCSTIVCSEKLRWRLLDESYLGNAVFF